MVRRGNLSGMKNFQGIDEKFVTFAGGNGRFAIGNQRLGNVRRRVFGELQRRRRPEKILHDEQLEKTDGQQRSQQFDRSERRRKNANASKKNEIETNSRSLFKAFSISVDLLVRKSLS